MSSRRGSGRSRRQRRRQLRDARVRNSCLTSSEFRDPEWELFTEFGLETTGAFPMLATGSVVDLRK